MAVRNNLNLLGIMGKKHSGKSEIARHLIQRHGFTRVSFADPLKHMLFVLGLKREHLWGDEKEIPLDILGGQTARHAMQTLGTEWGRNLIHGNLWVNAWELAVEKCATPVVVDDLRFVNEGEAVKRLGGRILLVDRPGLEPKDIHLSEVEMSKITYDEKILNDGSLIELAARITELIEESKRAAHAKVQEKRVEQDEQKEAYVRNLHLPAKDWEPRYKRGAACKESKQERARFLKG